MKKGKMMGKIFGIALVFVMIGAMLGGLLGIVNAAGKFDLGDTVEICNAGTIGIAVRNTYGGDEVLDRKFDGDLGMVLKGPQDAALKEIVYTWWKVRWEEDGLEGWTAEGYPGGEDYLKEKYVAPSTKFSINDEVEVINVDPIGLGVRTAPPDLGFIQKVYDGTTGTVTDGPFYGVPDGSSGFYHFWEIDYGSIVGVAWSAEGDATEDWLEKVTPCPHSCWDRSALSGNELAALVRNHFVALGGVTQTGESKRVTAYAVARAESTRPGESGANPSACGDNDRSIGLWQINIDAHPMYDKCLLFEEDYNAEKAVELSNNGEDWNHWCTWEKTACGGNGNEAYRQYLTEARKHFYPKVTSLSVSQTSINLGEAVKIYYSVSDDVGLARVELWRAIDVNGDGQPDWPQYPQDEKPASGQSDSGHFEDKPSPPDTYWYGIHVIDNSGAPEAWNDEKNSRTGGSPGVYGPIKVTVPPATLTLISPPNNSHPTCSVTFQWGSVAGVTKYELFVRLPGSPSWASDETTSTTYLYYPTLLGEYHWKVRAYVNGNWSDYSEEWVFYWDGLPAPSLVSPPNDLETTDLRPTFQWTSVSCANYYELQLARDSSFTDLVKDKWNIYSTSWQLDEDLAVGQTYYWRVRSQNPIGLWSNVWHFTVVEVNHPPTAYIDSITPSPANQGQAVSFSGHGADPDPGDSITAYNWRSSIDGQLSTLSSFTKSNLSVGTHTIYFKVKDSHNTWSTEVTSTLTINPPDTTKPTISITSPSEWQTLTTSTITVSGEASDNVGISKVEVKVSAGSWQLASGTTSWSKQITLSPGSNTIYARATDTSGNTKETSVTVIYNPPDIINPTISITFPSSGQTFTTSKITVSGTASDNVGISKVEVKVGAGSWQLASGMTSWSKQVTLSPGSNTIYARATDISGNTQQTSVMVTYIPPDTTPPTVSSVSPEDGATDVLVDSVVTATFSEAMDSSTITADSFTLSGSAVSGTVTYDSDTYTATFGPDANLDYDHEYTATLSTAITDEAGNPLANLHTWSFTTRPEQLAAHIKVHKTSGEELEPGEVVDSGESITFNGSGSTGRIVSYKWNFDDGTKPIEGEGKPTTEVHHRFRGHPEGLRTYHVTLTVKDDGGDTATDTKHVLVEPLAKKAEYMGPEGGGKIEARYNWVDEINGEDVYIISKICAKSVGIVGIRQVSITRDTYKIWGDVLIVGGYDEICYVSPFTPTSKKYGVSPPIETKTFPDGTFAGIEVRASDKMYVLIGGACVISGLCGGAASRAFSPDAPTEYPLEPYKYMPLGETLMTALNSPGELRVYDSQGRVTGLVNGEIKEEIPDSAYIDNTAIILSPSESNSYRYEVVGTEVGSYGLGIASVEDGEATTFSRTDTPIAPRATHQYTIDWDALSQGEGGVTIEKDSDGDGEFEETIVTSQPNTPSTPSPANNAANVSTETDLSWSGGDPDAGDIVTYDVYFDTANATTLVSNDQSGTTYDPGDLTKNTRYYWKIVARDNHGVTKEGPSWNFTTQAEAGRKGDFDNDGDIDLVDFFLFAVAYGSELEDDNYNPVGDFDDDGDIDLVDFFRFAGVYGT